MGEHGLATAGWTQEQNKIALMDIEVDTLQDVVIGAHRPVGNISELDQCLL